MNGVPPPRRWRWPRRGASTSWRPRGAVATMAAHSARSILRPPGGAALLRAGSAAVTEPFGNSSPEVGADLAPVLADPCLGVGGDHVFAGVSNDVSDEVVAVGVAEHVAVHGSWLDKLVPLGDTGGGFACSCRPTSGGPTAWVVIPPPPRHPSGAWLHETFTVAAVDASSLRSTLVASGQTGR